MNSKRTGNKLINLRSDFIAQYKNFIFSSWIKEKDISAIGKCRMYLIYPIETDGRKINQFSIIRCASYV